MPHCVTMRRAISVARSKSFEAPVVIWFMNSSSAMRPPNSTAIMLQQPLAVLAVAVLGPAAAWSRRARGRAE